MTTATNDLSRVFARQIATGKMELPPLPATASEVLSLCQQEATDAAKLSAVIHRDQTLASNVLRVANSAAHAGQVPCSALQQAVSRLGMQLVTEIAMAVAVRGRMFVNPDCAELLGSLWRHSVLAGFFTKEIARLRRRNVEIAFLCGLLHDVGKAALLNGVDRVLGRERMAAPVEELMAAVREQHVPAGALLAAQWQLPDQVAEAIAWHHEPTLAPRFPDMARMVRLADRIAHFTAPGTLEAPPSEAELRADDSLVALNVYPDQLDALLAMKDRALQVTEGMA